MLRPILLSPPQFFLHRPYLVVASRCHRWSLLTSTPLPLCLLPCSTITVPSSLLPQPPTPSALLSPASLHPRHWSLLATLPAADFPALSTATCSHPLLSTVLARLTATLFFLCAPQPHPSAASAAIFLHCFQLQPLISLIYCLQPHQRSATPPAAHSSIAAPPFLSPPPLPLLSLPPFCYHHSNPTSSSARRCHLQPPTAAARPYCRCPFPAVPAPTTPLLPSAPAAPASASTAILFLSREDSPASVASSATSNVAAVPRDPFGSSPSKHRWPHNQDLSLPSFFVPHGFPPLRLIAAFHQIATTISSSETTLLPFFFPALAAACVLPYDPSARLPSSAATTATTTTSA
ncbi:hypothetical protein BHM03_00009971 [Ensete ventricosum]|nr:hypothetical protein BHM03_00009971 [Ensete ventricosum]